MDPQTKPCRDCGEHKPLDQFPIQKGGKFGRHPLCKPCRAAQERRRYARDKDRINARKAANPERREKARWRQLLRKRGATKQQYETMYAEQDGRCAVCGVPHQMLHVDHDHDSGAVRGLLCTRCNMAIGHFRDDPARLREAAGYLRRTVSE